MMKLAITPIVLSTATFGLMLGVAQNAQASGLIRNIQSVTLGNGLTSNTGANINNIINGSGLNGGTSLGGGHNATSLANGWQSRLQSTTGSITFAFARNFDKLAGFSFWTANGTLLGTGNNTLNQGIKNMTIAYSTDNGATYTNIAGTPAEFAKGTATGSPWGPQVVNFSSAFRNVTHVRFNITGNWSSSRIAISEVQFRSIPEPSASLALLALGLAGMGFGLRKRV